MGESCGSISERLPCASWLVEALNCKIANGKDASFERVATDSRDCHDRAMFVALKGERSDGHDFAKTALENGASCALVSSSWWNEKGKTILGSSSYTIIAVPDPLLALQQASAVWADSFHSILKFGVTGSAGKTTTKEILASILSQFRMVVKNPGNLNSDIGLSSSIFLMRDKYDTAVFEMGINYPGEMDKLVKIYKPDCALITNIGSAHIGVLGGTRLAIANEKKKISSYFDGKQRLVIWEDDDYREVLITDLNGDYSTYGPRSTKVFEGARDCGIEGWIVNVDGIEARLRLPGSHNLLNAIAAMHTASLYGATREDIVGGLEAMRPISGRTTVCKGSFTVIDDCYNANCESMCASIDFCDSVEGQGKKVYVLGSMKELGDFSVSSHEKVGKEAAKSKADILFFYGEEARDSYTACLSVRGQDKANKTVFHFEDYKELQRAVTECVKNKDLVLIKASRSMELERLTSALSKIGGCHAV